MGIFQIFNLRQLLEGNRFRFTCMKMFEFSMKDAKEVSGNIIAFEQMFDTFMGKLKFDGFKVNIKLFTFELYLEIEAQSNFVHPDFEYLQHFISKRYLYSNFNIQTIFVFKL